VLEVLLIAVGGKVLFRFGYTYMLSLKATLKRDFKSILMLYAVVLRQATLNMYSFFSTRCSVPEFQEITVSKKII